MSSPKSARSDFEGASGRVGKGNEGRAAADVRGFGSRSSEVGACLMACVLSSGLWSTFCLLYGLLISSGGNVSATRGADVSLFSSPEPGCSTLLRLGVALEFSTLLRRFLLSFFALRYLTLAFVFIWLKL